MTLAAVGIVYGDIGTSPLYTLKTIFDPEHGLALNTPNLLGIISLIFWGLTLIVSLKYVTLVLRADNRGEGGIMALMALALNSVTKASRWHHPLMVIGVFGATMFYGDSVITPAISVLGAIEGLEVATPALSHYVVPLAVIVLEAAIEIDDAADEFWREDADAAVIEQIDAHRLAVFLEHGIIAQMRIAVDHRRMAERVPPGLEHGDGEPVADLDGELLVFEDSLALEPAECQQALAREIMMHDRNAHGIDTLKGVIVERDVLCLTFVIEFLTHALTDFLGDLARIDRRVHAPMDGEEHAELAQIRLHCRLHIRILQLAGEQLPICRRGAVDLAERGGGGGFEIKFAEAVAPPRAKLGLHPTLDESGAHGRRFRLQLLQFGSVFRRDGLGYGGEELRHFHDRALEPAQCLRERCGVFRTRLTLCTKQTRSGDTRGNGPHIGAHTGIPGGAG